MANAGANDNGSQFFFTLSSCSDLNKKHTIFGKVTGDTVYNLVRLGEVTTDDNDRPLNPPCIKWTKVLANPFDDVVPRTSTENKKSEASKKKKSRMKATKDFKLLSFGEEAAEEEQDLMEFNALHGSSSKSSHDLTDDPKLSSIPVVETYHSSPAISPALGKEPDDDGDDRRKPDDGDEDDKRKPDDDGDDRRKLKTVQDKLKSAPARKKAKIDATVNETSSSEALRKESRRLAREILKSKKPKIEEHPSESSSDDDVSYANPEFAEYKKQQKLYRAKTSSDKGSKREIDTLELLQRFNDKLHSAREEHDNHDDDDDDDEEDAGWLSHRLEHESELRDAKDMNREVNEDRYALDDPRNPLNKRRREKKSKKERRR